MSNFWGISIDADKSKRAEIPEGCGLTLTNVALASGTHSAFYVEVDGCPKVCVAMLDAEKCPQHSFSLEMEPGSSVKFSNAGDGQLSLVGCQNLIDDDEEYDDDEEIPSDFDYENEEDEDDEDEEEDEDEDEDEEMDVKGKKRPEPKQEKKVEKPAKQQKQEKPVAKPEKKPEKKVEKKPENKPEKKVEKKAEKKPEKTEKKPEKKPESNGVARCEICKRNFNSEKALEQHNAAKHGKK